MKDPAAENEGLLITESGFLTELVSQHVQRPERPFCFILGAGVSRPSGIPTGAEMAALWLREIHEQEDFDGRSLEDWATPDRLDVPGFSIASAGTFYPQLYRRRYRDQDQAGYAFLEDQMEGKEPSYGYSVLAYLLSETSHKVVVTTNFDNLVADALAIHSNRFPIVVGHDSLAQFASVDLRRPLIAKIHGALGFAPKSLPQEVATLPPIWDTALTQIMRRYTPIVLGYEGNDGSLMGFLESLPTSVPDRVFWCVYAPKTPPQECLAKVAPQVRAFVKARRGRFVAISGFDELMAKLLSKMRERQPVPDLYDRLKARARRREQSYVEQQLRLFKPAAPAPTSVNPSESVASSDKDTSSKRAVNENAASRREKPWWIWEQEAAAASTPRDKEAIYLSALRELPASAELLGNYALFLQNVKKKVDEADEIFQRAIEAGPQHANNISNYGLFFEKERQDIEHAEGLLRRATTIEPPHARSFLVYAGFLQRCRNDQEGAEVLLKRALAAQPHSAQVLASYAIFFQNNGHSLDRAEELFQQAIAAGPTNADILGDFARFMELKRQEMSKAEELFERAIAANPLHANNLGNYALFVQNVRWDMDKAEGLFKRAVAASPMNAQHLKNYSWFLLNVRKNVDGAARLSKLAADLESGAA